MLDNFTSSSLCMMLNSNNKNTDNISESSSLPVESKTNNDIIISNRTDILIETVRKNIIGRDYCFSSPFHSSVPSIYCDYIASGRSLQCIEDFIQNNILTTYANSHTTTSFTGFQTTQFREEAREIIAKCVNAKTNEDAVVFSGSGSTSSINLLASCLLAGKILDQTIVFIGPYEHHSNILPWREFGAKVIEICEDSYGNIDFEHFELELKKYSSKKDHFLMSSVSAGSNVTGVLTDVVKLCRLCKKYNCKTFVDYAGAAPYVNIDMNPAEDVSLDAIFISPHKFIGGPQTPGVLVAKRNLFYNDVPHYPGGGTVVFVDHSEHRYTKIIEEREEGGTPDIVGSIRTSLVFKLKSEIGPQNIERIELSHYERAVKYWSKNPNLVILGPTTAEVRRLPFFSLLVRHKNSFLHHSFIGILLNDLFGIQSRSGCACAGPYGVELLGLTNVTEDLKKALYNKQTHLKPGWTRLNINYFFREETIDYILKAVDFIGTHAYKFYPLYEFDTTTQEWKHRNQHDRFVKNLKSVKFINGNFEFEQTLNSKNTCLNEKKKTMDEIWVDVQQILVETEHLVKSDDFQLEYCHELKSFDPNYLYLRWFYVPSEVLMEMKNGGEYYHTYLPKTSIISPKTYPTCSNEKTLSPKRREKCFCFEKSKNCSSSWLYNLFFGNGRKAADPTTSIHSHENKVSEEKTKTIVGNVISNYWSVGLLVGLFATIAIRKLHSVDFSQNSANK
ncbi:hypothetical protein ABK040_007379 [Willaertia magna]